MIDERARVTVWIDPDEVIEGSKYGTVTGEDWLIRDCERIYTPERECDIIRNKSNGTKAVFYTNGHFDIMSGLWVHRDCKKVWRGNCRNCARSVRFSEFFCASCGTPWGKE